MIWVALAVVVGIYSSLQQIPRSTITVLFFSSLIVAGSVFLFSIPAYYFKIDRYYIVGLLVGLPFPFRMLTKNVSPELSTSMFFVSSLLLLLWGIILMKRFIQKTPRPGSI